MNTPARLLIVAGLLLGLAGCQHEAEPLPDGLAAAYADLLTYRNASAGIDSTSYTAGVDSILARHGFDRESFTEGFQRIGTSTQRVNAFFDSANVRLLPEGRR